MPDRMRPTGSDSVARSDGGPGRFLSRQEATSTYVQAAAVPLIVTPTNISQVDITAAATAGRDVWFTGGTYNLTSGLTWDACKHSWRSLGDVTLSFTGMTSGYAIIVQGVNNRGSSNNRKMAATEFVGFQILGPDIDATTVDCFYFNDPGTPGNLSQVNLRDVSVYGFRDQAYYDTNNWCVTWTNSIFGHGHRRLHAFYSGYNAGENYRFNNCTFYSTGNATFDGTAIYTDAAGNPDIYFYGCSFDYCDIEISHNSGNISIHGGHVEDRGNNNNPMVKLSYTPGQEYTTMSLTGVQVSPTESSPGRDHLFEFVSGDNISLDFQGCRFSTFGQKVDVASVVSGNPSMSINGGDIVVSSAPTISRPGQLVNLISNAGFETGAYGPWQKQSLVTYSIQSATVNSGTNAAQITGTGSAGSSALYQTFPCPPNTRVIFTGEIAIPTLTAGTVAMRILWLASDNNTLLSSTTIQTLSATQSFTRCGGKLISPPGTAYAQVQFLSSNLNGTVYVDDVYVAIMRSGVAGSAWVFGTSSGQVAAGNDSRITGAQQKRVISSISANTSAGSIAQTDYVYFCSGTLTLTLPTAVGIVNKYTVKNTGAGTVTIATTSSQTVDGSAPGTVAAGAVLDLISDGANWRSV